MSNLVFLPVHWEVVSYLDFSEYRAALDLLYLVSIGLLIVGILMVTGQSRVRTFGNRDSALLDAAGVNLSHDFIPRNNTNTYSSAEALRDAACTRLVELAKASGIEIVEQKSNAHSPNVWFRLDYLLPESEPELSLRAYVDVTIERYDHHRFAHLFKIVASVGTDIAQVDKVIDIDETAAGRIHEYILEPGTRLRLTNRVPIPGSYGGLEIK